MDTLKSSRCEALAHPNIPEFVIALLLVIGIAVSYTPQHLRIVLRRSSEGLSPYFVLLGTTSSTFSLFNILSLPRTQEDIACCRVNSPFACFAGALGAGQVFTQWASFAGILFLFLIFFPKRGPEPHPSNAPPPPTWETALLVAFISVIHLLALFLTSIALTLWTSTHTLSLWAYTLGICATVLACVQYVPQLWTTWRLQNVMSLSIPMMCIQTPGSFVLAASLAARLGPDGWSTWGMYVVTGCLQGCLLGMGIYFTVRDGRHKRVLENAQGPADERTGLLADEGVNHGTITSD